MATAGQVTVGRALASGVRIDSRTGLNCDNLLCAAMAGQAFSFSSLLNAGASTSLAASLGLPTEAYVQMMTLSSSGIQDASSAYSFTSPDDSTGQTTEADSFEMSNGQITPLNGPAAAPKGTRQAVSFSNPVISVTFNDNSTSIATSNSSRPASDSLTIVEPSASAPSVATAADTITIDATATDQMAVTSTPEPGTEMLIGIGLVAFGAFARVKRNASSKP
jgi:hypothetical protein